MQIGKLAREEREMVLLMRRIRQEYPTDRLAIVLQDELNFDRVWLAKRDYENQLMQQVILGMIGGKSPCENCEDFKTCTKEKKGCEDWWLRFLTKEEEEACEKRAKEEKK